jgi:hypothetical protein
MLALVTLILNKLIVFLDKERVAVSQCLNKLPKFAVLIDPLYCQLVFVFLLSCHILLLPQLLSS